MFGGEGAVRGRQNQHAAVTGRIAQRTGQDVAVVLIRYENGNSAKADGSP